MIYLPDVSLRFRYDTKDAKWRWLVEVQDDTKAGEEKLFLDAAQRAAHAAETLVING